MKKLTLLIIVLSIFTNCKNKTETTQSVENQAKNEVVTNENVIIKNEADYAPEFIAALKKQDLGKIVLDGNSFTIDDEKITFPQYPPFGKTIELKGKKDDLTIVLSLNRKNQTTIDYNISFLKTGKGLTKYSGQATISPTFYLGLESDESSISKLMYPVDEFLASEGDCFTSIRIGTEEESGKKLLGKLIKNCNGEIQDIDLDNFPTLVAE